MNFDKATAALRAENFSETVITAFTVILALGLARRPTIRELSQTGLFRSHVLDQAFRVLWEVPADDRQLAVDLWDVFHDWQVGQSLGGVGGCRAHSFRELLQHKQKDEAGNATSET